MAYSSLADFSNKYVVEGKNFTNTFMKVQGFSTANVASNLSYFVGNLSGAGNPAIPTRFASSTNLEFTQMVDISSGSNAECGGIYHGGDTGGKHLIEAEYFVENSVGTYFPATITLIDFLGFYKITTTTSTSLQTLTNPVSLPRYTDGIGVQAFVFGLTAAGSGSPNLSLRYTNTADVANRIPSIVTVTNPGVNLTANAIQSNVLNTGSVAANKSNIFIPYQGGDIGVKSIQSAELSASYVTASITIIIALCKVITEIPIIGCRIPVTKNFLTNNITLPKIEDGACLHNIITFGAAGGTNPTITIGGNLKFGWS